MTLRVFLQRHSLVKFVWQTVKAIAVITAVFSLLAWVPNLPTDFAWLFIFVLPVAAIAILLFIARLWARHGFGAVLSIITAIVLLSAIQYGFMRRDVARAIPFTVDTDHPIEQGIEVVDVGDLMRACSAACVEVLARTRYQVLVGDHIYRMLSGPICLTEEYRASYLQFLKIGYASRCVEGTSVRRPDRLLVIFDTYCDAWKDDGGLCGQLPRSFGGRIVTAQIDEPTGTRIAHRWLEGSIRPYNGWFALVGLEGLSVGEWRQDSQLLTRALGTEIRISMVTGKDDFDTVLTELEAFLDDPHYSDEAAQGLWNLSDARGRDNQAVLKAHIDRLLAHNDRTHIRAAFNLVTYRSNVDVSDNRARIAELSASEDPAISDFGRRLLRHIDKK